MSLLLIYQLTFSQAFASSIEVDRNGDRRLDHLTTSTPLGYTDQKIDRNFDGIWDEWNVRSNRNSVHLDLKENRIEKLVSRRFLGSYVVSLSWNSRRPKKIELAISRQPRLFQDSEDEDQMESFNREKALTKVDGLECAKSRLKCAECDAKAIAREIRSNIQTSAGCNQKEISQLEDFGKFLNSTIGCVVKAAEGDKVRFDGITMALSRLKSKPSLQKPILRCSEDGPPGKAGEADPKNFEILLYRPINPRTVRDTAVHELLHLSLMEGCDANPDNSEERCQKDYEEQEAEVKRWFSSDVKECLRVGVHREMGERAPFSFGGGSPLVKAPGREFAATSTAVAPLAEKLLQDASKSASIGTTADIKPQASLAEAEVQVPAGVHFEKIQLNGADASQLTFEMTPTQALQETTEAMAQSVVKQVDTAWDGVKEFVNNELVPKAQAAEARQASQRSKSYIPSARDDDDDESSRQDEPPAPAPQPAEPKIRSNANQVEKAVGKIGDAAKLANVDQPSNKTEASSQERPQAKLREASSDDQKQLQPSVTFSQPPQLNSSETSSSQKSPQATKKSPVSAPIQQTALSSPSPAPRPQVQPANRENYQVLIRKLTQARRDEIRNIDIQTLRESLDDVGFERELRIQGIAIVDADQGRSPASSAKAKDKWGAPYQSAKRPYIIRDGKLTFMGKTAR